MNNGYVVADEAESSCVGVSLHDPSEGSLGVLGEGIGLVEDHDLAVEATLDWGSGLRESLDEISDSPDSSGVGGIELGEFRLVDLTSMTIVNTEKANSWF